MTNRLAWRFRRIEPEFVAAEGDLICPSMATQMLEHPDTFAKALADVRDLLPEPYSLVIDPPARDNLYLATGSLPGHVLVGRGETAAAALRDLAVQLRRLSVPADDPPTA